VVEIYTWSGTSFPLYHSPLTTHHSPLTTHQITQVLLLARPAFSEKPKEGQAP